MTKKTESKGAPTSALHPRMLRPATFPPFDLYVRNEGDGGFFLFHQANEPVYANTWDKLERRGYDLLYICSNDRERCSDYVEENLAAIIAETAAPTDQVVDWTYRLTCRGMDAFLRAPESSRGFNRVKSLVDSLLGVLRTQRGAEWRMMAGAPAHYRLDAHCANVCTLMISLAENVLSIKDQGLLAEVALGAILHDVGKTMIPAEVLEKPEALTRREFSQIKEHPHHGLKIARPFLQRSAIAESIILQHHENACGGGYPEGRSGEAINVFARMARIADVFDALTSERPYAPALDEHGALNTMVTEMRGQFDVAMLREFIRYVGAQSAEEPIAVRAPVEAEEAMAQTAQAAEPDVAPSVEMMEQIEVAAQAPPAPATAETEETAVLTAEDGRLPEVRSIIRLEPLDRAEAAPAEPTVAAADNADLEGALTETLREKLDALRDACDGRADGAAVLNGLLGALGSAFGGPLATALEKSRRAAPTAIQSARQVEETLVRRLFPLVWQIDEWVGRFTPLPQQPPETAAACADARSCLLALREDVVGILAAHSIQVLGDTSADRPDGAGRVKRVGFVYHAGAGEHVLEPVRVILYPDLRKAG